MNIEHIKDGDIVLVKAKVDYISENSIHVLRTGVSVPESLDNIYPLPTPPKYDPNRMFRKGDVVKFKELNGRKFKGHSDLTFTLDQDERDNMCFWTDINEHGDIVSRWTYFGFLELVTPVEELEPFRVSYTNGECGMFEVMRGEQCVSIYPYGSIKSRYYKKAEQAKAAAEAECARLNAEHRKEQE